MEMNDEESPGTVSSADERIDSPESESPIEIPSEEDEIDEFEHLEFLKPNVTKSPDIEKDEAESDLVQQTYDLVDLDVDDSNQENALLIQAQFHQMENKLFELTSNLQEFRKNEEVLIKDNKESRIRYCLTSVAFITGLQGQLTSTHSELVSVKESKQQDLSSSTRWEREKELLEISLASKDLELARLNDALESKSTMFDQLKQELRSEKDTVTNQQAMELSNRSLILSQEQELAQHQKMNTWLSQELESRTGQFQDFRKEKSEQLNRLQSGLESSQQEKVGVESRVVVLQKRGDELEVKLSSKMDQLRDQFKNEMVSQKKLTDLYLGKSQEFSTHNEQLEGLVRELESRLVQEAEKEQASVLLLQDSRMSYDTQELELEQLKAQLDLVNSNLVSQTLAGQIEHLSGTAAAASRISNSGKSFTQIYSDHTKLQQDLVREKSEVARLTECLNHIVQEFEQRAPLIQKTNEEYQKAREQIEQLSINLSNSVRERNESIHQSRKLKSEMEAMELEQKLLQKDIEDRSRQIQAVLREQEILKGAHPASLPPSDNSVDPSLTGADAIISRRLVVFKNIEELQSQNQSLLRSIRSLSAKMEAQEKITFAQADEARLEALTESKKIIELLQDQLKRETLNSESFSKERDQWRRIAESRGLKGSPSHTNGTPCRTPERAVSLETNTTPTGALSDYETFYRDLQREFDIYRKESGTDTRLLKTQLEVIQNEKTEFAIQVAKLNNLVGYLNERHELLINSTQSKEKEFELLRVRMTAINETATRQDIKIDELSNNLMNSRQTLEAVNAENQQFKVERQILKSAEGRLLKESQDLLRERNSANDRTRELQSHLDDVDHKFNAKSNRQEDQVIELNRELQLSRKQVADLMDDHRTLTAKRDAELRESQIKIQKLTIDYERTKGDWALIQNKEQHANTRVQELTSKLTALEQKMVVYEGRPKKSGLEVSETDNTSHLESELRQVKIELEAAKAELVIAKDQADTFKAISQSSEDRLIQMNSTYDIYKDEMERKLLEQSTSLEGLEADKADMQLKISRLGETLTETQEKMDSQAEEFVSAKALYEKQVSSMKLYEDQSTKSVASMKVDLGRQVKQAQDSQANYEREVVLHSVALQSVAALNLSNVALVAEKDKAVSSQRTSLEKYTNLQFSFDSVKTKLELDITEMESRIDDLKTQNSLLHSQFEQLSLSKSQLLDDFDSTVIEAEDASAASKPTSNLVEVIKFLRREKDIVETKLQISLQENERSRVQIEHFQKSLDENRVVLDEERRKGQDFLGSERKHKELLDKIEQTNLLRESNITLRSQLEMSQKKIDSLDVKMRLTEIQIEPLKVSQLESEVDARKAEGKSLLEDNSRWKSRAQQILEKYERIDPVEHERLKNLVKSLTDQKLELETRLSVTKSEIESQISERNEKIKSLEAQSLSISQKYSKALDQKEHELANLRDPGTNEEIIALTEKLQASSAKNKAIALQANEKLKARSATIKELQDEIEALKKKAIDVDENLTLAIQKTELRLATEKEKEFAQLTSDIEAKWELKRTSFEKTSFPVAVQTPAQINTIPEAETILVETPSKRTREVPTPTKATSSPLQKRVRISEPSTEVPVKDVPTPIIKSADIPEIPAQIEDAKAPLSTSEPNDVDAEMLEEGEDVDDGEYEDVDPNEEVHPDESVDLVTDKENSLEDFVGTPEATVNLDDTEVPQKEAEVAPVLEIVEQPPIVVKTPTTVVEPIEPPSKVTIQRPVPVIDSGTVSTKPLAPVVPIRQAVIPMAKPSTPTVVTVPEVDAKAEADEIKRQKTILLKSKLLAEQAKHSQSTPAGESSKPKGAPKLVRPVPVALSGPLGPFTTSRGGRLNRGRGITIRGRGRGHVVTAPPPK